MQILSFLFRKDLPAPANAEAPSPEVVLPPPLPKVPPLPSELKLPEALMDELFPKRDKMVSVIFEAPGEAEPQPTTDDTLDTGTTQLPPPLKPQEVLHVSDELREAIFPKQKAMVSVVFDRPAPTPVVPPAESKGLVREGEDYREDFPIV